MNLCSEGHEEVCYESKSCPACDLIKAFEDEVDSKVDFIADLKMEKDDLQSQINELNAEINALRR